MCSVNIRFYGLDVLFFFYLNGLQRREMRDGFSPKKWTEYHGGKKRLASNGCVEQKSSKPDRFSIVDVFYARTLSQLLLY